MPKVVDRSKWVLLDHGQDQRGWIERSGKILYGGFRTRWRLPDGSERDYRERVALGGPSTGVKAAERLLTQKIAEFFQVNLTAAGLPAKGTLDTTFSWLLEKVKEARSPDWKKNTPNSRRQAGAHSNPRLWDRGDAGLPPILAARTCCRQSLEILHPARADLPACGP